MSRQLRRTKIVTTLGPATDREDSLEKMILAGANVVRLNFSHGNHQELIQRAAKVRAIADKLGKHIAILGDLQGPKIRVSTFRDGKVFLNVGSQFILDCGLEKGEGDQIRVGVDYRGLQDDVRVGDILLLDDGRLQLKVISIEDMEIVTEVLVGGLLSNNKGINKLGGGLSADALTAKDKQDILTAAKIGVDYLAVSFVRKAEDVHEARRLALAANCQAQIVAKIERAEAVASQQIIDEIIQAADVVMVARGDLGVEIGDPELIATQKNIIRRARELNRIVITATQMMESMITSPIPTRAEVMDVANAVLDGTDAVMLSAETAVGQYPVEAVAAMARVCVGAEKIPSIRTSHYRHDAEFEQIEEAIAMLTMSAANHLKRVRAIIAMTESGRTALMMSRVSSGLPIFAMSRHQRTLHLIALYRGVTPIYFNSDQDGYAAAREATNLLRDKGFLIGGDLVLITQGDDMGTIGSTNTTRILKVD